MSGLAGARSALMRIAALALLLAAAAALLGMDFLERGRERSVFFFPADSGAPLLAEARYLDISDGERDPTYVYLSEYLLGSSEPGRAAPFASPCAVDRCFVRENVAYIDISPSDSAQALADPAFAYRCRLLKKNICTNFKNIDTIYLYFDGVEVYAEKH